MNADEVADRMELRKLVDTYAAAADRRDPEGFAALFLPDGTFSRRHPNGSEELVAQGPDELTTKPLLFHEPPLFKATMHIVGNHMCEIDGDRATGLTYCLAHHLEGDDELEDVILYLWYDDSYVRTGDGWRFASRVVSPRWRAVQPVSLGIGDLGGLTPPPEGS